MKTVEELVSKDAAVEWLEHPVTAWFFDALTARADDYMTARANTFFPGDAARTQETISFYNGTVEELNALYGALKEDWEEGEDCPLNMIVPESMDE
jgi:hypothetical protein